MAEIARTIGCRREEVSRRASRERWRAERDEIRTKTTRKIEVDTVKSNATVLRAHDAAAEKLLAVATQRLDAISADPSVFDAAEMKDIASMLRSCATVQRAARGIARDQGMGLSEEDRRFVIEVRRLPPAPVKWWEAERPGTDASDTAPRAPASESVA